MSATPPYSTSTIWRAIVVATTIAGTLDILGAFALAIAAGGSPIGVLRGIGGAVIDPDRAIGLWANPWTAPAIGFALHFAIMTVMAAVYIAVAAHHRWLSRVALLSGAGYGVILWLVMYWFVLPQRWPTMFPVADSREIAFQLFSHILLVGIPIALVGRAARRWG